MRHLAKGMHDVVNRPTEIWCGGDDRDWTEDPEQCDCIDCLEAATAYGARAARQKRMLEGAA